MKTKAVIHMLYVQEMDRAVQFYKDAFGFEEINVSPFWSNLRCGNGQLALTSYGGPEGRKQSNLILEVDSHKAAIEAIKKGGGEILKVHEPYEGAQVWNVEAVDPENNQFVVSEMVNQANE